VGVKKPARLCSDKPQPRLPICDSKRSGPTDLLLKMTSAVRLAMAATRRDASEFSRRCNVASRSAMAVGKKVVEAMRV
jgi:hypothetical protein